MKLNYYMKEGVLMDNELKDYIQRSMNRYWGVKVCKDDIDTWDKYKLNRILLAIRQEETYAKIGDFL